MLNIIKSDLFKIFKGKALYGVLLALLGLVFIIAGVITYTQSESYREKVNSGEEQFIEMESSDESDHLQNGGEFLTMMSEHLGVAFLFLILPFIMAVFGVDYSTGTYRNLLSYHSRRGTIYLAKMITSAILTLVMLICFVVFSVIAGGIMLGFGGFTGAVLMGVAKALLLMLPVMLAMIGVGYCVMTFTKKTSATIAVYLIGITVSGLAVQLPMVLFPKAEWISQLDLTSSIGTLAQYGIRAEGEIMVPLVFSAILIAGTYILGVVRYKTTDFDFN